MNQERKGLDFVYALWKAKLEPYEDRYCDPYHDGLMYLFNLMHLSGKYRIITPQTHSIIHTKRIYEETNTGADRRSDR